MRMTKLKILTVALLTGVIVAGAAIVPLHAEHDHEVHPGDPVKQTEHMALFALVADSEATHRAVADGAWGDPKTWDKQTVPGPAARVVIPADRTVTVAGLHDKDRLDWVRVDGTLRFDPTADTALKVVTLVGDAGKHHRNGNGQGARPRRQIGPT